MHLALAPTPQKTKKGKEMTEDSKGGLFGGLKAAFADALYEKTPGGQQTAPSEDSARNAPAAIIQEAAVISLSRKELTNGAASEAKMNEQAQTEITSLAPDTFVSFRKILDGLASVIPDENSRVQAALVALNTQNITTETIYGSFDAYLAAIDDYDRDFKAALASKKQAKDSALNIEIANLSTSIEGIKSDLKTLQESLDALNHQREEKQAVLLADANRFDSLSNSVSVTIETIRRQIIADKAKIAPKN